MVNEKKMKLVLQILVLVMFLFICFEDNILLLKLMLWLFLIIISYCVHAVFKKENKNSKCFNEKFICLPNVKTFTKELIRHKELEIGLRNAIKNREIYMVFQPQISLNYDKKYGFEALVRWESGELGFISPAEFIPVAERSGIIIELGEYIIEESFKMCKELSTLTDDKFKIAINISEIQLSDESFIDLIFNLAKKYELSLNYIEFEITESLIMKSINKNIQKLSKLRELGATVALDDFGTGYSSLNYLRRLPIDVVKVDKSFVDGIGLDKKSECITESIIRLSHDLDLIVIAEGVETQEQLKYLNRVNCDIVQGYYFSKPEKFNRIKEMMLN